jgi:hypothetical protein
VGHSTCRHLPSREPILIRPVYNFDGTAGIAFISGFVERTDRKTGETRTLPYSFNDMRFMQGRFEGRDGHVRDATFAFT